MCAGLRFDQPLNFGGQSRKLADYDMAPFFPSTQLHRFCCSAAYPRRANFHPLSQKCSLKTHLSYSLWETVSGASFKRLKDRETESFYILLVSPKNDRLLEGIKGPVWMRSGFKLLSGNACLHTAITV